jgi:hypothetical protein
MVFNERLPHPQSRQRAVGPPTASVSSYIPRISCEREISNARAKNLQRTKAKLLLSPFNVGYEWTAQTGVNGQVGLRPASLLPELANTTANPFANVTFHLPSVRCTLWATLRL